MAIGILAGLILVFVAYGVAWAIWKDPKNPVFGEREPKPTPVPDPKPERLQAAGLPPSPRFQVGESTPENFGGILGTGTPSLGPAPPSIGYEPDANVIRVDELDSPAAARFASLGEE